MFLRVSSQQARHSCPSGLLQELPHFRAGQTWLPSGGAKRRWTVEVVVAFGGGPSMSVPDSRMVRFPGFSSSLSAASFTARSRVESQWFVSGVARATVKMFRRWFTLCRSPESIHRNHSIRFLRRSSAIAGVHSGS